jgi:hypothetical protein
MLRRNSFIVETGSDATFYRLTRLDKSESERKIALLEKEAAMKNIAASGQRYADLKLAAERFQKGTADTAKSLDHMTELNAVYNSNIKVHRRIQSKMEKHLECEIQNFKMLEADTESQRRSIDKVQKLDHPNCRPCAYSIFDFKADGTKQGANCNSKRSDFRELIYSDCPHKT